MNATPYAATFNAMKNEVDRLETITENLANSTTTGYRKAFPVGKTFNVALQKASASSESNAIDFSTGAVKETGNPFDFAINGDGFFVVGNEGREYYTRNGHFTISPDGELVTDSGLKVLNSGGTSIKIPKETNTSNLLIDNSGTLKAGNQSLAQLKLVKFPDNKVLTSIGTTLYGTPEGMKTKQAKDINVQNRALEGSNTVVFEEMADMITCMRSYESCSRILKAQDNKDGQIIQQLL